MLQMRGRITGEREVLQMYAAYPQTILRFLIAWMRDERAGMVGGPDSRKRKRRGYRDILAGRTRRYRGGTWSRSVAHQFKGYIGGRDSINNLHLTMGVGLRHPHQITRALEMLETGGTIRSGNWMLIPMYQNLNAAGFGTRARPKGIFNQFAEARRFAVIKRHGQLLFFDRTKRKRRGRGEYQKQGLMFIGRKEIKIPRMLTGRYDFYSRWERRLPSALNRGQRVLDRATHAAETNPNYGRSGPD